MLRLLVVLLCLVQSAGGWAADLIALPTPTARVNDLTGTLTADQRATLESACAALEKDKGAQVTILLLASTQPETIEQFGIRLAEAWRIGRKGTNDGVIVIVAKDDRKMRIEVGYGLEGAIPDALAKRIVAETMAPHFKQGDFAGGLQAAVDQLAKIIAGEPLPVAAPTATNGAADAGGSDNIVYLFLALALGSLLRSLLGVVGAIVAAAIAGWLAWAIFASWLAAGLAALAAFLLSFVRGGGGWHAGGAGGGGFSSSSGGGFSGGGGSFGGGGASGDW
jgi:uncharacterized protein